MITAGETKVLRIDTQYDLSAADGLKLIVHHPDGSRATITDPRLSVGNVDVVINDKTLNANEYVLLTTTPADFPLPNDYRAQLSANDGSGLEIYSQVKTISVGKQLAE